MFKELRHVITSPSTLPLRRKLRRDHSTLADSHWQGQSGSVALALCGTASEQCCLHSLQLAGSRLTALPVHVTLHLASNVDHEMLLPAVCRAAGCQQLQAAATPSSPSEAPRQRSP
jgi:hypothetical protein